MKKATKQKDVKRTAKQKKAKKSAKLTKAQTLARLKRMREKRIQMIKKTARSSAIHSDYANMNTIKSNLTRLLRLPCSNPNKLSQTFLLNKAQLVVNQLKAGNPYRSIAASRYNIDNIENNMATLRGAKSALETDYKDPTKVNAYNVYRHRNVLLRMTNLNKMQSYVKALAVPKSDYQAPVQFGKLKYQNEICIPRRITYQFDDLEHVADFDNEYGHHYPGSVKYIAADGKTYYFTRQMIYNDEPTMIPKMINNRNNYQARANRELRLSNNDWNYLHNLNDDHRWFKYNDNDTYMAQANKATGDYQFRTAHDEIWYTYHLDRVRNDKNCIKDLRQFKRNRSYQYKINKLQKKINRYNRKRPRAWYRWVRYRDYLKKRIRPLSRYAQQKLHDIKHNQDQANWWLNIIKHRNANFKATLQENIDKGYYNATLANVRKDPHYTKYGYIRPRNPQSENDYLYFKVDDESPAYETQVNATPAEHGVNAATGTERQQTAVTISGELFNPNFSDLNKADGKHGYFSNGENLSTDTTNPDYAGEPAGNNQVWRQYWNVRDQARRMRNWNIQAKEMFYSGQEWYPHCIISEFTPDMNNTGDDGSVTTINFSMTLVLTQYFQSNLKKTKHGSHNKGGKGRNRGKKSSRNKRTPYSIPVKQGYTYGMIARRYHVSVAKLRRLNPWADRRIAIFNRHGRRNRIRIR